LPAKTADSFAANVVVAEIVSRDPAALAENRPLPQGSGRVEKKIDDATYVITFGREKITVRVPEQALDVGQNVKVTVRDGQILIEPLEAQTPAGKALPAKTADSFTAKVVVAEIVSRDPAALAENRPLPQGSGRVEKKIDDATCVIAVGREKITVRVPEQALDAGQNVKITVREGQLLIEAPAIAGRAMLETPDSFKAADTESSSRPAPDSRPGVITLFPAQSAGRAEIPEGFYRFPSAEKARSFMGTELAAAERDSASFVRELERALAADGAITLKAAAAGRDKVVTFVNQSEVEQELASLRERFSSRAFQSVPPEVFARILDERQTLDLDLLKRLDALAVALSMPAAGVRAGSREAQSEAMQQWLATVSDSEVHGSAVEKTAALSSLVARLPVFSATSMIDMLAEVSADLARVPLGTAAQPAPASLPHPERFAVTADLAAKAPELFQAVFSRLGYDHESSGSANTDSLKALLVALAKTIETAAPSPAQQELLIAIRDFKSQALSLVSEMVSSPMLKGDASFPSMNRGAIALFTTLASSLDTLVQKQAADLTLLVEKLPQRIQELVQPGKPAAPPPAAPPPAAAFVKEAEAAMKSLVQLAQKETERFVAGVQKLLAGPADAGASSAKSGLMQQTGDALLATVKDSAGTALAQITQKADEFRPHLARMIETLVREAVRDFDDKAARAETGGTQQLSDKEQAASSPQQALRQNLDALITRIESFQLLARQAPVASGDQQIIAVPIKIGNEWTEMNVRFIHKKRSRGGAAQNRFAVELSVAPALLGAISARMEYRLKQSLRVTMEFESSETRQWFIARKAELRTALAGLGIPVPQMDFIVAAKPRPASGVAQRPGTAPAATVIDVKA
jgi:hypothetical protein